MMQLFSAWNDVMMFLVNFIPMYVALIELLHLIEPFLVILDTNLQKKIDFFFFFKENHSFPWKQRLRIFRKLFFFGSNSIHIEKPFCINCISLFLLYCVDTSRRFITRQGDSRLQKRLASRPLKTQA